MLWKEKYTPRQTPRAVAKVMGGGVVEAGHCGVEEKSETSQKKGQPLPSISQVPKEKEQKTRLPPPRTVCCTPEKCQPPRTWRKGRVVFTRPFWCKDPPGRRGSQLPGAPSPAAACPPPGARPTWPPAAFVRPRRPRRRGCQRDNCGAAGRPGRSGVRGAGAAGGRSYLPSREKAMPIPSRGAVPLNADLPGFRQLAAIANRPRKVWRRRKRLERKFSLAPHSLSLSPGGGKAAGNQDSRRAGSGVHLLLSRPRQRAQGGCPAPGLPAPSPGPASRDAARPTHHGDSRRDRASGVSGCRGAGAGTQSPGRTSKVGSLRQKQALDNPRTHKNQWEPWGDSIHAGSAAVGEGEQEAA